MASTVIVLLALPDEDLSNIGTQLHEGTQAVHLGQIQEAFRRPVSTFRTYANGPQCANCSTSCLLWTPDFVQTLSEQSPGEAHRWLQDRTGAGVIVDSSGSSEWLSQVVFERRDSRGLFAVHCVRNPVEASLQMQARTSYPLWRCAEIWRSAAYDVLRTCAASNIPLLTVQVEGLPLRKEAMLDKIAEFSNISGRSSESAEQHPLVKHRTDSAQATDKIKRATYEELAQIFLAPNIVDLASLCGYNGIATIKELLEEQSKPETA